MYGSCGDSAYDVSVPNRRSGCRERHSERRRRPAQHRHLLAAPRRQGRAITASPLQGHRRRYGLQSSIERKSAPLCVPHFLRIARPAFSAEKPVGRAIPIRWRRGIISSPSRKTSPRSLHSSCNAPCRCGSSHPGSSARLETARLRIVRSAASRSSCSDFVHADKSRRGSNASWRAARRGAGTDGRAEPATARCR